MNPAPGGGNVYFAGILLMEEGNFVRTDRLSSVRWGGPNSLGYQAQYPYGVEYTTTANDREKYATYTRDSNSGMDYAMNRYYSSQWGRFLSPDRRWRSAKPDNPQSWNRYTYVLGDPTNLTDPSGLYYCASPGLYNLCPVAYGIMDSGTGDILSGDDGDDGGDGGGGCPDPNGGNNFDPTPEPPGPNPCPPPAPSTPLDCDFGVPISSAPVTTVADGQAVYHGFFLPISFYFTASGGRGQYLWSEKQTYSTMGSAVYSSGHVQNLGDSGTDGPLSYTTIGPGGSQATYRDAPGLVSPSRWGNILGAIFIGNFQLSVSVTDLTTGQTAPCPTVWWQAWEIWGPQPSGQDYVVQVTP
jgi:RHS repeat-associated protein